MKVTIKKSSYRGADGSSLSDERCVQFIKLYDCCALLGDEKITYKRLQEIAEEKKLFGSTQAGNAIRTFAPLLYKLGFVDYSSDSFSANSFFTKDGRTFIEILKAYFTARNTTNTYLVNQLKAAKQDIQRLGLHNMYLNPSLKTHNIWLALGVIQTIGDICWDEFGYLVKLVKEDGYSINKAIELLEEEQEKETEFEYVKEDGKALPNTFYSYIHSFLLEAGIIYDPAGGKGYSKVCDEAEDFLELINIDCDGTF